MRILNQKYSYLDSKPGIRWEGEMDNEEIAIKLCEDSYSKLDESNALYPFEKYWEMNKEFFVRRAKTYLEVKGSLEE